MASVKDNLMDVVRNLPTATTYDAAIEAIIIRARFDAGKEEIATGNGISHQQVIEHFDKWLK